jgi:hypothetical protein
MTKTLDERIKDWCESAAPVPIGEPINVALSSLIFDLISDRQRLIEENELLKKQKTCTRCDGSGTIGMSNWEGPCYECKGKGKT